MKNISIIKTRKEYFPPQLLIIQIDSMISLCLDSLIDPGGDPIGNVLYKNNDTNPFGNIV
ncbi:MAG TPA: hypothetical protein P5084_00540 [Paludibacter sp.]|nr:hypothetical protein [Paludibacter sp.]